MAVDGNDAAAEGGGGGLFSGSMFKMIIVYMLVSQFFKGKPAEGGVDSKMGDAKDGMLPPRIFRNAWTKGQPMELWVYVSERETFDSFHASQLIWHEPNLAYSRDMIGVYQACKRWALLFDPFGMPVKNSARIAGV